jgi:hypothetical protein
MITQFTTQQKRYYKHEGKLVLGTIAALSMSLQGCLPKEVPPQQRLNEGLEKAKKELVQFDSRKGGLGDYETFYQYIDGISDRARIAVDNEKETGNLDGAIADLREMKRAHETLLANVCTPQSKEFICKPITKDSGLKPELIGSTFGQLPSLTLAKKIAELEAASKYQKQIAARNETLKNVFGGKK